MNKQAVLPAGRIALIVEYDGHPYCGWQIQKKPAVPTVQEQLEKALSVVANHPVTTLCAGRTDTGVHGCGQVVHFDTNAVRHPRGWVQGVNTHLPDSIAVRWAGSMPVDFHARFSATRRTYRYVILNQPVRSPALDKKATLVTRPLDVAAMQQAADYLLGELDFSAFRGAGCQSNSPFRFMESIQVQRYGDLVVTELCANAFLLHMVRNIMGVLMAIGTGEREPVWAQQVLESRDRRQAGLTAKPHGLYLVNVSYPSHYALPSLPNGPAFLPSVLTMCS